MTKEIRVFAVNPLQILRYITDKDIKLNEVTDEAWMQIAEEGGNIWSLKGFEEAFNRREISTSMSYIIRIISA